MGVNNNSNTWKLDACPKLRNRTDGEIQNIEKANLHFVPNRKKT